MKTYIWDASKYLKTKRDVGRFLKVLFDDLDADAVALALYDVIKARGGIRKFSREVGVSASRLSKIITGEEEITLSVLIKILHFFKLTLTVK